jgi:hypothetical protein
VDNLITNKSLGNSEASRRILDTRSVKISVLANTKNFLEHHEIACHYGATQQNRSASSVPIQVNWPLKVKYLIYLCRCFLLVVCSVVPAHSFIEHKINNRTIKKSYKLVQRYVIFIIIFATHFNHMNTLFQTFKSPLLSQNLKCVAPPPSLVKSEN